MRRSASRIALSSGSSSLKCGHLDKSVLKQVKHPQHGRAKSRGNVIYADELAEEFSVDGARYYALAEMPYSSDGSITYESFIKRFNMDLVNNAGNEAARKCEVFTTVKGNQFVYWRDEEADWDLITKIN